MLVYDGLSPASSSLSFEDPSDPTTFNPAFFDDDTGAFSLTLDSPSAAQKQMSAAAFDLWNDPLGGQPVFLPDSLAGTYKPSDENLYDLQSQTIDFSTNFLGPMPQPQRLASTHRRRLSHSSIPSQSSASPYSQPASLQYTGQQQQQQGNLDPSSRFMEPGYGAYQSPQFQQHNLPTPSHTPTSDTFSERSQRRSQLPMHSKLAMTQNQNNRNMAHYTSGDSNASNAWQANNMYSSQELPHTPRTMGGAEDSDEAYHSSGEIFTFDDLLDSSCLPDDDTAVRSNVPKFDRTMSEAYQDELYLSRQNTHQQQQQNYNMLSPFQQNMVSERMWAQQNSRTPTDSISRDASPFRQNSPWVQSHPNEFSDGQIGTAAEMRRQQKEAADAHAYRQHHPQMSQVNQQPKTISPKDVVNHDYQNPEEPAPPSLFPETSIPESNGGQEDNYTSNGPRDFYRQTEVSLPRQGSQMPTSNFNFVPPTSGPQYQGGNIKFTPPQFRYQNSSSGQMPDFAAPHLVSMETSASEDNAQSETPIERPSSTTADSGTYTCTYHGCTQRFESPAKLQKHKREDHRSAHHGHGSQPAASATPELADRNSQAGPHKCERINPTTGKPCNTIFSRPYDLTRHEDTIHNARKKKVRCQYCTEEKTFSRADALSRHMRVVHPDIEFPGKHGRRRHE